MTPAVLAARAELARLAAAPLLDADDLARLPVLAATLGIAVRVKRAEWAGGWENAREYVQVFGAARE